MKIIDRIREHQSNSSEPFFSFEFYPPKTEAGIDKLYKVFDSMKRRNPMWVDVTWGAGGGTADSTMKICLEAKSKGLEVMMHLTCTNMDLHLVDDALKKCKEAGIMNILALRGDPPAGQEWKQIEGGFANAVDLVRHIKKEYGDYFCIGVAGYPEGHETCVSFEQDMIYLKEKCDAGADMIVTQLFYDTPCFIDFVQKCKDMEIAAHVFPGIMPIQTYGGFKRMTTLCKTKVPKELEDALEAVKDEPEKVKALGVEVATKMCTEILQKSSVLGLHFYTLNMEEAVDKILLSLKNNNVLKIGETSEPIETETVFTSVPSVTA